MEYFIGGKQMLDDLIFEYKVARRHANIKKASARLQDDKNLWSSISSSLDKAILYMETGCSPWDYKRTAKASTEERTVLADNYLLDYLNYQQPETAAEKELGDLERKMLRELIGCLSPREKECYLLNKQSMFSIGEVAEYLGIAKNTVEDHLQKARKKIEKQKQKSLYVLAYESELEARA
ncbi:sigma factor-like helix-turn-helix DNA-binding protein [Listeria booriae]|uniref:sigma factor-like helix-turn-helix DNA-binding protein n=1 Tax=Listeria booriae TaxID=1552123 RepID=UPI0021AB21B6|nr:sigma factor-like helix-turn-helix DNA-binding protein [Listeria booriae]